MHVLLFKDLYPIIFDSMAGLKEREERLKFILSKVNTETEKFRKILSSLEARQEELSEAVSGKGISNIPVNITPHTESSENLYEETRQHIMELTKLKSLIETRLNLVIKEEELIAELKEKYGDNVSLAKLPTGEFQIEFRDGKSEDAFEQLKMSRKMIGQLRDSVHETSK